MSNPRREDDWAKQVPNNRNVGPYEDYGWERHESVLPEFRDPDVHEMPYEEQSYSDYNRGRQRRTPNDWRRPGPYTGMGPEGYHRSDERIKEDVSERLTRHGQLDARGIHVDVQNGEVTLTGEVDSRQSKREAERVADSVHGVSDVHNQIKINPARHDNWTDRTGRSNVYPASGPMPKGDAETHDMASWGQGERGAQGYQDHGESELPIDDNI
jgi:hypothetical protein